jgi:hypothetical protein
VEAHHGALETHHGALEAHHSAVVSPWQHYL